MKTDRFSDIIRRKLESIRPEFTEKDWTRMQASLQTGVPQPATPTTSQPFGGGIWTAKPWLMAAAAVSAVVMVTFGYWQHQEINRLRDTISQLKKPAIHKPGVDKTQNPTPETNTLSDRLAGEPAGQTDLPATSSADANSTTTALQQPRDTVYITRYVPVPSKSYVVPPDNEQTVGRSSIPGEQREQRYATTDNHHKSVVQSNQSDNLTNNPNSDAYGELSTSSVTTNNNNAAASSAKTAKRILRNRETKQEYITNRQATTSRELAAGSAFRKGKKERSSAYEAIPNGPSYNSVPTGSALLEPEKVLTAATFNELKSKPMSASAGNWTQILAQRARRMRPARTTIVGGTESATNLESQRVTRTATRFRAGVGGEIASKLMGAGVFAEVLLGKNWVLNAGLSQTTYTGDKYNTDFDFDVRMRRNFRKEFKGVDPRRDIFNIDTRTTRLQVPLSLGYRIPVNRNLAFTPTVGTYMNLGSTENATYYCPVPIPQRGFEELSVSDTRTVPLINTFTLGAGVEWQQGHWVLQGIPILNVPVQTASQPFQPDPNWQSSTVVGLRARLLYQF